MIEEDDCRCSILFITINSSAFFCGINDPVFTDASIGIKRVFGCIVQFAAAWRDNFYNKIRSAIAAFVGKLTRIAYHTDIWFDISFLICIYKDSKRGDVYLTLSILGFYVMINGCSQLGHETLMNPAGRCYVIKPSADQLCALPIRQIIDILKSIDSFF